MILVLKKPFNPGDTDPGRTYTHLHIEQLTYNSSAYAVSVSYAFGSLNSDESFVAGKGSVPASLTALQEDLDAMQNAPAQSGEPALAACLRLGYVFLQKKLGIDGDLDLQRPSPAARPLDETASKAAEATPSE